MVKELIKRLTGRAKGILSEDPHLLYKQQRHLVNEPFFFDGQKNESTGKRAKGILLVHGWTSTPYEVRRLGEYLNEAGYTVSGIQLTGHGTMPSDLENVSWKKWYDDLQKGYEELRKTCDKVYIGGTSIGADLTLIFAKENPEVDGIIIMAAPYKLRTETLTLFAAKLLILLGIKYRKKFYPPTFGASNTITRLIAYQIFPLASVVETFNCVREARKNLYKIKQPCFVLQSTHDHIVSPDSLERIHDEVGSEIKRKKYIEKAYHTFISDIKNEHVFSDILEFLEGN